MMRITDELIDYICDLSRLRLSEDEKDARKKDLTDVLNYMDKLNELDTSGMPEMTHPFDEVNRFREDSVLNVDRRQEMLSNSPDRKGDFFKVYKTVE
jgi:aspartyl-tRNA(Asn)/glutamyl-tRNA(Gln) amidotransferase subunit C